jgi:hypothetical protein
LYGCTVGYQSHATAQGVYFAHDLSLGYTSHGRIAAHLCNLVHVHRYEARLCSHIGRSRSRFASGVSATYYKYVVMKFHSVLIFFGAKLVKKQHL